MTFLFALVPVMLCTLLALVRVRRFGRTAYFLAVVVSELPQLAAAYLALSTAFAWSQGDLSGTVGVVLTGFVALTLAAHVWLLRRGLAAGPAVRRGLAGAGIEVEPGTVGGWLRRLMLPFPVKPLRVYREAGLPYGDHRRQRLDVYGLRSAHAAGPVLLYLHGGGYFTGSRHWESRALLHHFASRGWTCISASYRLRPRFGFEDHLADARAALAWAHRHAAEYGGDATTLVMAGSSAGAHLSTLCALSQRQQDDREAARVDAVIGLYGYYGRYYGRGPDEEVVSSPIVADARSAPPILLAHGDHDSYVPVAQARELAAHLADQSPSPVAYVELPGATHGFDLFSSWRFTSVIAGIDAFLAHVLGSGEVPAVRESTTRRRASA